MPANPFDAALATTGKNPFDHAIGGSSKVQPGPINRVVGGAIQAGSKDPIGAVMGVLGAPQRALESLELDLANRNLNENPLKNAFDSSQAPRLAQGVKTASGIQALENGPLAGESPLARGARGVVDFGANVINDPLTYAPVGKIAELVGKSVPAIPKAFGGIKGALESIPKAGHAFDPFADIGMMTDKGKAAVQAIKNRAVDASMAQKVAADKIIAAHAEEIRRGVMHPDVTGLFSNPRLVPKIAAGTRPQDVTKALLRDRLGLQKQVMNKELQASGFTVPSKSAVGHIAGKLKAPGEYFKDPAKLAQSQKALSKAINSPPKRPEGTLPEAVRAMTRAGNKAFLSIPFPHGANLTNLSYNRYGLPTTLKGLASAARVSTGHIDPKLAARIAQLEKLGAHSQYGNIYDELGLTRVLGIPGTEGVARAANKAIIPAERLSNYAQNKFLNPLETGLRSAALGAEERAGKKGVEAAHNIHAAFGSSPANAITRAGEGVGAPFIHFHAQTAPGSALRTLATNPGRIATGLKVSHNDYNGAQPAKGQPKYNMSVPTTSGAKALANPLGYWPAIAGPIGQLAGPYSALSLAQKGKVSEAVSAILGRYIPASALGSALMDAATGKAGTAGESGASDILPALLGGYWSKQK